jgi:hypothetical protein
MGQVHVSIHAMLEELKELSDATVRSRSRSSRTASPDVVAVDANLSSSRPASRPTSASASRREPLQERIDGGNRPPQR